MGGGAQARPRSRGFVRKAGGMFEKVGALEDFAPGSVTDLAGRQTYLSRSLDGSRLFALSRVCPHRGGRIDWGSQMMQPQGDNGLVIGVFRCFLHGSGYDRTGDLLSPPSPRGLDRFPIKVEGGAVWVDFSAGISSFDPEAAALFAQVA